MVESAILAARRAHITDDVQRTVIAQQVVPLEPVRQLVNALQINAKQPPYRLGRRLNAVEEYIFVPLICACPDDVPLVANNVDQLKLFEH